MSFTLQQSSFLTPLLGDTEMLALFSVDADVAAMLQFEGALALAQAKLGILPVGTAEKITSSIEAFKPDFARLSEGISRDGLVVPALVTQLKAQVSPHLHYGATSQDVIDTSLMLRAKKAFAILQSRTASLTRSQQDLTVKFGKNDLMARTRMQRALPFSVADRVATWRTAIEDAHASLSACSFPLQFGGPIGVLNEFGDSALPLKTELAGQLGLAVKTGNWHSARGPIVAIGNAASLLTGALGKLGMDYCLMAQNEIAEVKLAGGGTSSAMQHKQNPVLAETLVTLARFNATQISGLHHSMVHEQERSGAAWTLEWMILPQMVLAAGAATRICAELLRSTISLGQP